MFPTDIEVLARPVAHLPVVRSVLDDLGIVDVIDEHLPRHPLNRVSDAECVVALILNVLCGRPALYRMEEWLDRLDLSVLFGHGAGGDAFNDTRLAEALDHIDEVGTDTLMAHVAKDYIAASEPMFTVHHDTTSVSLFGVYADENADPRPARGFSKDHRPDLKQLIYGLTLHGAVGVPLVYSVDAGNTHDAVVARDHLARLAALLPPDREVTIVGDCKLVDARTLGRILRAGLHFVSLVPDSFKVRRDLIEQAWRDQPDPGAWPTLGTKAPRRKDDSETAYRGMSYLRSLRTVLEDADGEGAVSHEDLHFVVVYSDVLAARFDNALEDRMTKELAAVEKAVARMSKKGFDCEADALTAGQRIAADVAFHEARVVATFHDEPLKRAGPGRPRKEDVPAVRRVWRVQLECRRDDARIAAARKRAGSFVLVTDWLPESWSAERVLAEYRHQHLVEGHTGFRWLKGPAAVAPVFLKTPERVRAMGLVLVLALMVRNYIQGTLRAELERRGDTLAHPFTKKPETRPTTEMVFEHFAGLETLTVCLGTDRRRQPMRLSATARQVLDLLGLDTSVFDARLIPRPKSRPRPAKTPGM